MDINTRKEIGIRNIKDIDVGFDKKKKRIQTNNLSGFEPESDFTAECHDGLGDITPKGRGGGTLPVLEDTQYETQETNNHLGTARDIDDTSGGGAVEEDRMVSTERYIERFVKVAGRKMKSTNLYLYSIRTFCKEMALSKYTRKQIQSKGKNLIVGWLLDKVPTRSRRYILSHLKLFWEIGLELDWPVKPKRDLPKMPRPQPRETPPDDVVKQWAEAMENEPNLETRAYWYGIAEHGWRSSHLSYLEWSHVRWRDGKVWAVIAQSENFKTSAPLITVLGPKFSEILSELRKGDGGDGYVFPKLARLKSPKSQILNRWKMIQSRYGLPSLKPNGMRHWVSSTGHEAKLSKPALAGMLGHDASVGSMADWYDNRTATTILDEQETKLPHGILAYATPPKIEIVPTEHKKILELWSQYVRGEIGTMEFASKAEVLKSQQAIQLRNFK